MQTALFHVRDLEMLVAIHQTGSMRRAADRLQCTSSALSHRLHDLESRVGSPLVERNGRAHLTASGVAIIPRAEQVLALMGELHRDLTPDTPIRSIGVSTLLMTQPYLTAIGHFVQRGPAEYAVQTGRSTEVEDWVSHGQADVGLVRLERVRPDLHYQVFEEDRLVAVSSRPISVAEAPWVLFSNRMGHGAAVNRALRDADMMIRPKVTADSFAMALELVKHGWISVLPWSLAGPLIASHVLVEIEVPKVVWPPRRNVIVTRETGPHWVLAFARELQRYR